MSWDYDLVVMVRALINDIDSPQNFDDDRIQSSLLVGGLISTQDFYFSTSYSFDFSAITLTPDPTLAATYDMTAMALFSLKAACILNQNSYTAAIGGGIKVRDGDSEVDTTGAFRGYRDILELGPCGNYSKLISSKSFKDSMKRGKAVMGGISHINLLSLGYTNLPAFWNSFAENVSGRYW